MLLVFTLRKIYNGKKQAEQEKQNIHTAGRKGTPGSGMEVSPVFKEIKELKSDVG